MAAGRRCSPFQDRRSRFACISASGSVTAFCCVCVRLRRQNPPDLLLSRLRFLAAVMYRGPVRPQRSPGAPRPPGRFPSPSSCWGFPGPRSPYGGSGHRGGSPHGGGGSPAFSPGSPIYSPGFNRGYRSCSPAGPGSGSRGFGGQNWRRSGGFPRPQSGSPASAQKFQVKFVFFLRRSEGTVST